MSFIHDTAPPEPGRMPPATPEGIEQGLARSGREIAALQERLDQAQAEVGHARRRAAADVALARSYALRDMALDLLPLRDALEAALAIRTADAAALRAGLELACRQFAAALARHAGLPGERS
ncbi:nucleotide exchange factor GrpE [Massilia yuzhufengensis]|uniref:Molecular chaperone GrpE n=1 Tax=Massilia yuzhufengensis TaxID=1164594 RepID=A0A1I1QJG0_9BURK|nr:nucleotide exchange factor GrpE [Massilia yuzhufengensis]SFD22137.1 molecular chaperone GrpE [Massilia yuzhufengensis]